MPAHAHGLHQHPILRDFNFQDGTFLPPLPLLPPSSTRCLCICPCYSVNNWLPVCTHPFMAFYLKRKQKIHVPSVVVFLPLLLTNSESKHCPSCYSQTELCAQHGVVACAEIVCRLCSYTLLSLSPSVFVSLEVLGQVVSTYTPLIPPLGKEDLYMYVHEPVRTLA